ncbi:MAG: chromosome segregation protein SMC [Anaerolineales bacterium]|nr:chromosome segregation protein SMC [Anaerolineales bacterium]
MHNWNLTLFTGKINSVRIVFGLKGSIDTVSRSSYTPARSLKIMLLKKLELQGYKTFASRTEFVFESGITAIVGPNGSGKSNVADAIRWVLGEQSYRLLRGKKTEDMIFAGSQKRARAGMAQASLVLDNSAGEMDLDFTEVEVTRKAYRSGENEYRVNGSRVRLRDTVDMLSSSGLGQSSYNVIGQGLVDAALSLRANERRALFEDAAGISLYKERREDTISRLDETQRNLVRVDDILSEIRPRMRRLERQAVRSREYAQVNADLENLLFLWYGFHWEAAKLELRKARSEAADQSELLEGFRDQQSALEVEIAGIRNQVYQLRNQLGDWHNQNSKLHRQAETIQRNLAVHVERQRMLVQQKEESEIEIRTLGKQQEKARERLEQAEKLLAELQKSWKEQQAQVIQARIALEECQKEVAVLRQQEKSFEREFARLEAEKNRLGNRRVEIGQEQQRLLAEGENIKETIAQQQVAEGQARSTLTGHEEALAVQEKLLQEQAQKMDEVRLQRQSIESELSKQNREQQKAMSDLARLEAQHRALADLRSRGEGHDAVVGKLLALKDRPEGILAPLVQLFQVPAEYEQAISAALGKDISALVVQNQQAAIEVMAHPALAKAELTCLPLESLRPAVPIPAIDDQDVIGAGADLVECQDVHRPAVGVMLGRVLLVRTQEAALRLAPSLPLGSCAVTPEGVVIHQDGRMVKPGQQSRSGLFAQERTWRELPDLVSTAQARVESVRAMVGRSQRHIEEHDQTLQRLDSETRDIRQKLQAINKEREAAALQLDRLAQNLDWNRQQLQENERRIDSTAGELLNLDREQVLAGEQLAAVDKERKALQARQETTTIDLLAAQLSALEQELARSEGARRNQRSLVDAHRNATEQVNVQIANRRQRIFKIDEQSDQLSADVARERQETQTLADRISRVGDQIKPAEEQLEELEAELETVQVKEEELKRRVRSVEQVENRARLNLDRQETHLEHLRSRIQDELGLVHLPLDEDISGQTPLPLGEMVGQLPVVKELPEGLQDSIQRRKQQLKRMGPINPDAPAEYEELEQRYTFLTEQVQDLEETDQKLRQAIAELDEVMERQFKSVFTVIAAEFTKMFTRLFGGGAARLILTEPENPIESGVEIVARPPGRRQQGLALLSGGERSLTAVALVFSLLKASPTPFCVLDEVDAMLDEANVGRFRDILIELSKETQIIVITHNRGTVQAADTIYGVSMGDDGVSQVVSLRLDGDRLSES